MCQHHQVYTTMCLCASLFTIIFKELITQFTTPFNPNTYAKLDHLSGTRWPIQTGLPLLIVRPSIINVVINFSTHLWPVKWNVLGYTFALCIPFHLLQYWCNTCTNQSQMIWSTSYHHVTILVHWSWLHLLFTVASVHWRQVLDLPFTLATGLSSQVMSWSSPP
jgi:hypothetical protein